MKNSNRKVLGVVALALMMVVSAVSGLNVALTSLARETGATQSQLQWIVDAYTMVFCGLLLPAGALGDRYGRRPVLLSGLVVFGLGATGALFVSDPNVLIGLRAVMGAGAALVMPTTLSIITSTFPEEERATAVGVWVGIAGGGAIFGLWGAGALLEFFEWNSFFALNVALAIVAFIGAVRVIPDSREADAPRLDWGGGVLALVAVTALVFGIIEGPERGWSDPLVIGGLGGGVLALAAFVAWELRRDAPLLDPRLFRLPGFAAGSLSLAVQFFAAFGFFFVILQYLQGVAGLSPLTAAQTMLPMSVTMIPLARRAPRIAERFGLNRVGATGLVLLAAGLVVLSTLGTDFNYPLMVGGLVLFGVGMALAGTPATTAITESLPPSQQGVASAMNDLSREFGSAIGIALLGSILTDRYSAGVSDAVAGLPAGVAEKAESSLAFVKATSTDPHLVGVAQSAFVDAASTSLLVGAGVAVAAAVFVAVRAPRRAAQPGVSSAAVWMERGGSSPAAS